MRGSRSRRAVLGCCLALGSCGPAEAQVVSIRTVVLTGDPIPGEHTLLFPTGAILNEAGSVAFTGRIEGPGIDDSNDEGIWLVSPGGAISELIREGDPVPGQPSGVGVSVFDNIVLNDRDEIAFNALESGPGLPFSIHSVWGPDGAGGIVRIAAGGTLPPGGLPGDSFADLGPPELANDGVTIIEGFYGSSSGGDFAIYRFAPPGPLERMYGPLVALAGLPVGSPGAPYRSRSGLLALEVVLELSPPGVTATNRWAFLGPDGAGGFVQHWRSSTSLDGRPWVNDLGHVAFASKLQGPGIDDTNSDVWYGPDANGELGLVARQGSPAPGLPDAVIARGTRILLNDAGELGLSAQLRFDGQAASGIFGPDAAGDLGPRLVSGTPAPGFGPGASVRRVNDAHLNNRGEMLIDAIVADPASGNLRTLYWSSRNGAIQPVVHQGQEIEVRPGDSRVVLEPSIVPSADSPLRRALNDSGEIVFAAFLEGDATGIFLATVAVPEPTGGALGVAALLALAARTRLRGGSGLVERCTRSAGRHGARRAPNPVRKNEAAVRDGARRSFAYAMPTSVRRSRLRSCRRSTVSGSLARRSAERVESSGASG